MSIEKLNSIKVLENKLVLAQLQIAEYREALRQCSDQFSLLGCSTNVADEILLKQFDDSALHVYSDDLISNFRDRWTNSASTQGVVDASFEEGIVKSIVSDEIHKMIHYTLDVLNKYALQYNDGESNAEESRKN